MADIKKLFNEELPAALTKNAEDAKTIGAKFQINIAGEGEWNVDVSATGPSIKAGTDAADCTINIPGGKADFEELLADPQGNGTKMFMTGKLKVDGNPMLALKLNKLFGYK